MVKFKRYPAVFIFSTGDELKSTKDSHGDYIRDTNSVMIKQILEQDHYKGHVSNFGIVRDKCVNLNMYITVFILIKLIDVIKLG